MMRLVCALSMIALIVGPVLVFAESNGHLDYGLGTEFSGGPGVYYLDLTKVEKGWIARIELAEALRSSRERDDERDYVNRNFETLIAIGIGEWQDTFLASKERVIVSVVPMARSSVGGGGTTGLLIVTQSKSEEGQLNKGN